MYGIIIHYPCTPKNASTEIVAFSDASHATDGSQLFYLIFVAHRDAAKNSATHTLEWSSHKSRQPVQSALPPEFFATAKAIESIVPLCQVFQFASHWPVKSWLLIDSKDLWTPLTTQRSSVDESTKGEVSCIWFIFKSKLDFMDWITAPVVRQILVQHKMVYSPMLLPWCSPQPAYKLSYHQLVSSQNHNNLVRKWVVRKCCRTYPCKYGCDTR